MCYFALMCDKLVWWLHKHPEFYEYGQTGPASLECAVASHNDWIWSHKNISKIY